MTDDYARGLDEIRALRERLAHLEEVARASTTRADGTPRAGSMLDAIGDHYAAAAAAVPVDRKTKALQQRAYGFHRDPGMEQEIATRAKDPKFYDAEMRRIHGDVGTRVLYEDRRSAAIALGRFDPNATTEEEAS
jgi:hypothetical protein